MNTKVDKFLQWLDKKNELTCGRRDLGREMSRGNHILDYGSEPEQAGRLPCSRPFTFANGN